MLTDQQRTPKTAKSRRRRGRAGRDHLLSSPTLTACWPDFKAENFVALTDQFEASKLELKDEYEARIAKVKTEVNFPSDEQADDGGQFTGALCCGAGE